MRSTTALALFTESSKAICQVVHSASGNFATFEFKKPKLGNTDLVPDIKLNLTEHRYTVVKQLVTDKVPDTKMSLN